MGTAEESTPRIHVAQFKKVVSAPGTYQTPDGLATVTPERIRHWHDTIHALLREGYKPPISWGHLSKAVPHTEDDTAYWASRFNAGKVIGAEIDGAGQLVLAGDAPGVEVDAAGRLVTQAELPDHRKVKAAIEEVSIGAFDWTDGKGRVWKDAPVHLALTPLPVWVPQGGQPGFEAADLPQAWGTQGQRFGLGHLLYRFATETTPMAVKKEEEKPSKKEGEGAGVAGGPSLKKVLEMLGKCGITLPDDTSEENLLERLYVACTAKEGAEGGGEGGAPEEPVAEEPGATFMATNRDPAVAVLLAEVEAGDRTRRLARITGLVRRGLQPHLAKKLREAASQVRFAVGPTGQRVVPQLDAQLELLEAQLPPEGVLAQLLDPGAGALEAEPPESAQHPTQRYKKVVDEQLANSRLAPRQGQRRRQGA